MLKAIAYGVLCTALINLCMLWLYSLGIWNLTDQQAGMAAMYTFVTGIVSLIVIAMLDF